LKKNYLTNAIIIVILCSSIFSTINFLNIFNNSESENTNRSEETQKQDDNNSIDNYGLDLTKLKIMTKGFKRSEESSDSFVIETKKIDVSQALDDGIRILNVHNQTLVIVNKLEKQYFSFDPILINNNVPLENRLLEVYFKENDQWNLIDAQFTNNEGKCTFKIQLSDELIKQVLIGKVIVPYKVIYKEDNTVIHSESASLILEDYDGPDVYDIVFQSYLDSFFYATGYVQCYKEWWHLWIDDLKYVEIKVSAWGNEVFEYRWDCSGEGYTKASLGVYCDNWFPTGTPVEVEVTAKDEANMKDSRDEDILIVDDDPLPPAIYRAEKSMNVINGELGDYVLSLTAYDVNFFRLRSRYKYGENGQVHYFNYQYFQSGYHTAKWNIPLSEWIQYQGLPLYWSYYGEDYDNDHFGDGASTGWNSWIEGDAVYTPPPPPDERTLILIHGFNGRDNDVDAYEDDDDVRDAYANIFNIEYYDNSEDFGEDFDKNTPIEDVSQALAAYIIDNHAEIRNNVDFVCHSMGGLITRYLIKHYYRDIQDVYTNIGRVFKINHVCMIGTPNHGVWYGDEYFGIAGYQLDQMECGSDFLTDLNSGDETPYGSEIEYYTYFGRMSYGDHDTLVSTSSVRLEGADNRGPYDNVVHGALPEDDDVMWDVKYDLDLAIPERLVEELNFEFILNTVLNFMNSLNLAMTLLELAMEIINPIVSDVIEFIMNPTIEMTLRNGTTNVYELQFSYPDGTYPCIILAEDPYGNQVKYNGNVIILDDDVVAPQIDFTLENGTILSDEEAKEIVFEWNITDQSGIGEASVQLNGEDIASYNSIEKVSDSYEIPNDPGQYIFEIQAKDNDNDPGHDSSENDWLESYAYRTIDIYDDDELAPEIDYIYTGDGTDGNPGEIIVYASDDSGLSVDPSGNYPVPNELGIHTFTFTATDNDNDRLDDSLTTTTTVLINIEDDDTTPPDINIGYEGNGFDSDPGYFWWDISDLDDGIGGDGDIGLSYLFIKVDYQSPDGLSNEEYILPINENGIWDLPPVLGMYTITILARDNDNDRTLIIDSLNTEVIKEQEITDDDVDPPNLSNLVITHNIHNVCLSFEAIDYSGIENIVIIVNDEEITPIYYSQNGNTYLFVLANKWILMNETITIDITVSDADNDRPNDSLSTSISGTLEITLEDIYDYVDWQIEILKCFIKENLCCNILRGIIRKLEMAQIHLRVAYHLIETDRIPCALFHDKIAKMLLLITEFKFEIFNRLDKISDDDAKYIITSLHDIRNNIVALMGISVGTEISYNIALIEIDLLNLNDLIKEEIDWCNRKCLEIFIRLAATTLERAIIKSSLDFNIEPTLTRAQQYLEFAKIKVNCMLNSGKITQDLADILLTKINQAKENIEITKNL